MPFYCNTSLSRNKKVPRPSVRRTGSHMKCSPLDIRGKRAVRSSRYHSATSASSKTSWSTECTTTLGYQIKTMCIMEQTKSCTWCPGSNLKKRIQIFMRSLVMTSPSTFQISQEDDSSGLRNVCVHIHHPHLQSQPYLRL